MLKHCDPHFPIFPVTPTLTHTPVLWLPNRHANQARMQPPSSLNVKLNVEMCFLWIEFGFKAILDCAMFRTERSWFEEGKVISAAWPSLILQAIESKFTCKNEIGWDDTDCFFSFSFFFLKSTWWEINKDECRTVLWWHARRALAWKHYCLEPLLFLAHSMSTLIFQSGRLHADFYNWQTFYQQNPSHVQYKLVRNCRLVGFPIDSIFSATVHYWSCRELLVHNMRRVYC